MKRFHCTACQGEVFFDSHYCGRCDGKLGFVPATQEMVTVEARDDGDWQMVGGTGETTFRLCPNRDDAACNWLIDAATSHQRCDCCRHNRMIPDLTVPQNQTRWSALEEGKRNLFYSILRWNLPHPVAGETQAEPLIFDFLADGTGPNGEVVPVMTGHADGLITIATAEGDEAVRAQRRKDMGEPYRTLIGHFRHEVGHYYWDLLVRDGGRLDAFRQLFGDDRQDYGEALNRLYSEGPAQDWRERCISSYASVHPWEDWAETWAHYFHICDTLETARAYQLVRKAVESVSGADADVDDARDGYSAESADALARAWVPVTVAVNAINRSMGQPDVYPFVLNGPVVAKLQFIHETVHAAGRAAMAA